MKYLDFLKSSSITALLNKMAAPVVDSWNTEHKWIQLTDQELAVLAQAGIDVDAGDINLQISPEGYFEYKGKKVVVYIRDQYYFPQYKNRQYKFHITECKTLVEMRRKQRFSSRYVVTDRKDGLFLVNLIDKTSGVIKKGLEKELNICKNCLSKLKGNTYLVNYFSGNHFDLVKYFNHNTTQIVNLPRHNETTAPISTYPGNWSEISHTIKSERNWACENKSCSYCKNANIPREHLHVHHIDGNPANNSPSNLKVLCIGSHAEEFRHDHLKFSHSFKKFLNYIENKE